MATGSSRLTSSPRKLKREEEKRVLPTDGSAEGPRSSLKGPTGQSTQDIVCSLNNDLAEDRRCFGQAGVMCPLSSSFPGDIGILEPEGWGKPTEPTETDPLSLHRDKGTLAQGDQGGLPGRGGPEALEKRLNL